MALRVFIASLLAATALVLLWGARKLISAWFAELAQDVDALYSCAYGSHDMACSAHGVCHRCGAKLRSASGGAGEESREERRAPLPRVGGASGEKR